ncbi:MAG: hypothetical protein KA175_07405 [Flavobacteriales bacterium]|nr:hypothetical protein [Flavobacteriales bacterium]MBP6697427.1 hypothetical protein [Flavobacteriales bacterium]
MTPRWPARWNHEYLPWYIIYLPVVPGLLYHAIRQRSLVFFTNVDPAIDMGGFFGERKSSIYALLPKGSYPTTLLVEPGTPEHEVRARIATTDLSFPLILKPDVGERGEGVLRVDDAQQLFNTIASAPKPMLLQQLVAWPHEYGLMFAKDPRTERTALLSITGKRMLTAVGDGQRTVEQLLAMEYRGRKQIERLRGYRQELLARVPAKDEEVVVEPIGNHCRGALFHDAWALFTPSLERAIDELLAEAEGLYYGRVDVRAESEEALRAGRFIVLELNGVSSEPGHIYDPSYSLMRSWSELLRHVKHIPPISAAMRAKGHEPVRLADLLRRCETHFGYRIKFLRQLVERLSSPSTSQRSAVPGR